MSLAPGNSSSYNVAPGESGTDYRRKIAAQLLLQGSSGEPVQHWTQGAARIAQALAGGYDLYQANKEDEVEKAGARKVMMELMGGGSSSPAESAPIAGAPPALMSRPTPSPMAPTPPAGPQPGSPAMRVAGGFGEIKSGIDTGMIDPQGGANNLGAAPPAPVAIPSAPRAPVQVSQALSAPVATQPVPVAPSQIGPSGVGAPIAEPRGGLTPERRQELLGKLLQNKYGATYAQPLFQKELEREAGRMRPLTAEEQLRYPGASQMDAMGKAIYPPPNTMINLNTAESGLKAMAGKGVERYDAANLQAREAQKRIAQWDTLSEAMKGFSPGATAPMVQGAKRYLKDLGLIEGADVPDAQVFQTVQKQLQIHAQPKGQGAVSNFERELFSQAIPNIGMDPASLSRMITISKRLDEFDIKVARAYRDNARANGGVPNPVTMEDDIDKLGAPLSAADIAYMNRAKDKGGAGGAGAPPKPGGPIKIDANGNIIQ